MRTDFMLRDGLGLRTPQSDPDVTFNTKNMQIVIDTDEMNDKIEPSSMSSDFSYISKNNVLNNFLQFVMAVFLVIYWTSQIKRTHRIGGSDTAKDVERSLSRTTNSRHCSFV